MGICNSNQKEFEEKRKNKNKNNNLNTEKKISNNKKESEILIVKSEFKYFIISKCEKR